MCLTEANIFDLKKKKVYFCCKAFAVQCIQIIVGHQSGHMTHLAYHIYSMISSVYVSGLKQHD